MTKDADSVSMEFVIIADETCDFGEKEIRHALLSVYLENNIHQILELSSEYFERFGKRNVSIRKQVGCVSLKI